MLDPVEALTSAFPQAVEGTQEFRGEITVIVDADSIVEVCRYCRDTKGLEYNFLSDVAGWIITRKSRVSPCRITYIRWCTTGRCG